MNLSRNELLHRLGFRLMRAGSILGLVLWPWILISVAMLGGGLSPEESKTRGFFPFAYYLTYFYPLVFCAALLLDKHCRPKTESHKRRVYFWAIPASYIIIVLSLIYSAMEH
jgi:hypothetical protein